MTDDTDLLAALRAGSPEAARTLYDTYGAGLYAFLRRRTGDEGLAREIVQDVMLKVWRSADAFDPDRGTLRAWIFQIARNAAIDSGRRKRSRPQLARELTGLEDVRNVNDELDTMFRGWLISAALDRLPTDHRAVVDLVYFQQLKIAEASRTLGIPEGTVKSRCFYALANLRSAFDELGVITGEL